MTRLEGGSLDATQAGPDFEIACRRGARSSSLEEETHLLRERVATEQENRGSVRHRDRGAGRDGAPGLRRQRDLRLVRDAAGWDDPGRRRSGPGSATTVVEVVGVVLVIVNYLFPNGEGEYG